MTFEPSCAFTLDITLLHCFVWGGLKSRYILSCFFFCCEELEPVLWAAVFTVKIKACKICGSIGFVTKEF